MELINEARRMQQLAGIINESQLEESMDNEYIESVKEELEKLATDDQELQDAMNYWNNNALEVEYEYSSADSSLIGGPAKTAAEWIISQVRN